MSKKQAPGISPRDQANRDLVQAYRATQCPHARAKIYARLFADNQGLLGQFVYWYDARWLQAEAYLLLEPTLRLFDLSHKRMSVVGHWVQTMRWKLPEAWARENALIMPPKGADAKTRELLRGFERVRPDAIDDGWAHIFGECTESENEEEGTEYDQ